MKTKQVKFTGIQPLDEYGYVRINFTGGVSHDIDALGAIADGLDIVDMIEEIEFSVNMHEAAYSKAEGKKLAKALASYCFRLDLVNQFEIYNAVDCISNPYIGSCMVDGTSYCYRFSNKRDALDWARKCAHRNRKSNGTAYFFVRKHSKTIYSAAIWQNGKTSYYVNNGVEA